MSNLIVTNDGKYYQKPSTGAVIGGVAAGTAVATATTLAEGPFTDIITNGMRKQASGVNYQTIGDALQKALAKSGLEGKVHIDDLTGQKPLSLWSILYGDSKKGKYDRIKKYFIDQRDAYGMAVKGKNAFFNPKTNKIILNVEKLGTSGFHEIGHAINYNNSKFWRAIQKSRPIAQLMPLVILGISLFKRKKADGEAPKGFFDKTTTFIKENAGKLAGLSMVPIVLEELKATSRGNALAKQLLSPENFKKVVKTNRLGALTYIAGAGLVAGTVWAANKVKDAIAKPKEVRL